MKKMIYPIIALLLLLVGFGGGFVSALVGAQRVAEELNSLAGSNSEFAYFEFFQNLPHKTIRLHQVGCAPQVREIAGYRVIHVPIEDAKHNRAGIENQIAHRTGIVAQFAAYHLLHGDKTLGYQLLGQLCELYPGYHLYNRTTEEDTISHYMPRIDEFVRSGQGDLSLLKEISLAYEWHEQKYSIR